MKPIRVLIADDHALLRAGLRALLCAAGGIEVVGEAADGREALEAAQALNPDVAVVDVAMAGMNGIEAIARIRTVAPDVHVIVLSMYAGEEYVAAALRAGACGYLVKDSAPEELVAAVRSAAVGRTHFSPPISREVVEGYLERIRADAGPHEILTPRQREVLQRIAEGHSTKGIAFDLGVSPKTIESHRAQLMQRLGIRDVAGLVRYAIRHGLVSAAQ